MSALIYPKTLTVTARALALLIEAGEAGITHRTLDIWCRSYRLSSDIHKLRKAGWPIETERFLVRVKADANRPANIARYWLPNTMWATHNKQAADLFVRWVRESESARHGGRHAKRGAKVQSVGDYSQNQYSKAEVKA